MRNKLIASATLLCSALAVATAPMVASAQEQHQEQHREHHRHRVKVCHTSRGHRNTGTVVGAVAGGLLGNALSHGGGKTGGTIIGAGAGAVAGHEIAKRNGQQHCHWEWRD